MRDYIGQTPEDTGGTSFSGTPDIITYGQDFAPDASIFTTAGTTGCDICGPSCNKPVVLGQINWVYLRCQNTTPAESTATLSFYYSESDLALWPQNWKKADIYYNNTNPSTSSAEIGPETNLNWTKVTAPANTGPGTGYAVTNPGFIWNVPQFSPGHSQGNHYCLIGLVDETAPDAPYDIAKLVGGDIHAYKTFSQLVRLVTDTPYMVWRNTIDIQASDGATWQRITNITGPTTAATLLVNLVFSGFPPDCFYELQIPGPDGKNYVSSGKQPVPSISPAWHLNFVANFKTTAVLSFWQGDTDIPKGATVRLQAIVENTGPPHQHNAMTLDRFMADDITLNQYPPGQMPFNNVSLIAQLPNGGAKVVPSGTVIGSVPFTFR